MVKYQSLDEEIKTLTKLYFDMSETARGYARQSDLESANELHAEVQVIRRKLREARLRKAAQDDPPPMPVQASSHLSG